MTSDDDGAALRARILGTDHAARTADPGDPMLTSFVGLAKRNVWDGIWTRPELGLRERSLATISLLIALGHADELDLHFRGALRNDLWSRDELFELCLHATAYCGFPAARAAFRVLQAVLADEAAA